MCEIRSLSLIASRLLVALMAYGVEEINAQPKTKMMEMVGTRNEDAYYAARTELERLGFIRVARSDGKRAVVSLLPFLSSADGVGGGVVVLELPPEGRYVGMLLGGSSSPSTGGANGDHPRESRVVVPQLKGGGSTPGKVGYPTLSGVVVPQEEWGAQEEPPQEKGGGSLLDRCREADEMDVTGPETSTKSPFGVRRLAQVPLVQEAYRAYFPQDTVELNPRNAKAWLGWNNNRAEDVLEGLQDIAQRKPDLTSPVTYIRKVFGNEAKGERGNSVSPPLSSAALPVPPKTGAEAYVPGGDLPKPSPEYLAQLKAAAERFEREKQERGWVE